MLIRLIGLGRVALGLAALGRPQFVARLFALPPEELTPSAAALARLTGNRDLVLGAALLLAPAVQQRAWLRACAAVDAADVFASLLTLRDGLGRRAATVSAVAAAGSAALELLASRRLPTGDR